MKPPNHRGTPEMTIDELVSTLNALRDNLVKTSLLLQDYRFEIDSIERNRALQNSDELIERIKPR